MLGSDSPLSVSAWFAGFPGFTGWCENRLGSAVLWRRRYQGRQPKVHWVLLTFLGFRASEVCSLPLWLWPGGNPVGPCRLAPSRPCSRQWLARVTNLLHPQETKRSKKLSQWSLFFTLSKSRLLLGEQGAGHGAAAQPQLCRAGQASEALWVTSRWA
jgi:hypothetical protein